MCVVDVIEGRNEKEKLAGREMGPLSKGSIESSLETGSPTKFCERLTRIWH